MSPTVRNRVFQELFLLYNAGIKDCLAGKKYDFSKKADRERLNSSVLLETYEAIQEVFQQEKR